MFCTVAVVRLVCVRAPDCMHSVKPLAQHWGPLCKAEEGCTLHAKHSSVADCVAGVSIASSASPDAVQTAEVLNSEEVVP